MHPRIHRGRSSGFEAVEQLVSDHDVAFSLRGSTCSVPEMWLWMLGKIKTSASLAHQDHHSVRPWAGLHHEALDQCAREKGNPRKGPDLLVLARETRSTTMDTTTAAKATPTTPSAKAQAGSCARSDNVIGSDSQLDNLPPGSA